MSETPRRIGEAKPYKEILTETNSELIGNLMKGVHLDGGGKPTFYKDQAKKVLLAAGILNNDRIEQVAKILYEIDYDRFMAVRSSMLKRSTVLKLRFASNGKNVEFKDYLIALNEAIKETKNHSKKLLFGISS